MKTFYFNSNAPVDFMTGGKKSDTPLTGCINHHWESLDALLSEQFVNLANKATFDKCITSHGNDIGWWGCDGGWLKGSKLITHGWPEGLDHIRRVMDQRAFQPLTVKRRRKMKSRGPIGEYVDMQRVYCGDLGNAWSTTKNVITESTNASKITLVVHPGANCNTTAQETFWNGAAAITILQNLILSGYRVQLVAAMAARDGWASGRHTESNDGHTFDHYCVSVELLQFGQVPNYELITSALALGAFFRGHLFKAACHSPLGITSSLGYAQNNIVPACARDITDHSVILIGNVLTEARAKEVVSDVNACITRSVDEVA